MTQYTHIRDDSDVVLKDAHDVTNHAIRVTGNFVISDITIDCLDDSIAIGDADTGELAQVINGRLQTDAQITAIIPDDYRTKTITSTNTAQTIDFTGFDTRSLAIRAMDENPGYIRVGKSNILSSSDEFFLLAAGDALNISLTESTVPIYHGIDPAAPIGVYRITVIATN